MKLARFLIPNTEKIACGILENSHIKKINNTIFEPIEISPHSIYDAKSVRLLPPVEPAKIVLVGLNYKDHALELGMKLPAEPIVFLKPATSITAHLDPIIYPNGVGQLDYEAELAVIIKKITKNIDENRAKEYILGYTCLNDVTARDLQKKDTQWTRAKSFDTFCPVGPFIETRLDTSDLSIRSYLNDELRQSSSTRNLIFGVNQLISFISGIMTLLPGDIIATGTPPGVGPMKPGDVVKVEIEGIGILANPVVSANPHAP